MAKEVISKHAADTNEVSNHRYIKSKDISSNTLHQSSSSTHRCAQHSQATQDTAQADTSGLTNREIALSDTSQRIVHIPDQAVMTQHVEQHGAVPQSDVSHQKNLSLDGSPRYCTINDLLRWHDALDDYRDDLHGRTLPQLFASRDDPSRFSVMILPEKMNITTGLGFDVLIQRNTDILPYVSDAKKHLETSYSTTTKSGPGIEIICNLSNYADNVQIPLILSYLNIGNLFMTSNFQMFH